MSLAPQQPALKASPFPQTPTDRDAWILARRGPREHLNPQIPYAFLLEEERFADQTIGQIATLFLTNRECPFRCTMCDLWRNTLTETVPEGAIPTQITHALANLSGTPGTNQARQIKLYNSGSFFDPRAIPIADYPAIAALTASFERVIVESHPAFIAEETLRFQSLLTNQDKAAQLEVAIGLETAHPRVLAKLNKRMTLAHYAAAANRLHAADIALRTFLLIQPPFLAPEESYEWTTRSIDLALRTGSTAISLIPTRPGNGAVDQLALEGHFTPPTLTLIEDTFDQGLRLAQTHATNTSAPQTRIFLDLWELERFAPCPTCRPPRIDRLRTMNLTQQILPRIPCPHCESACESKS